jgi:hypothetical protein
MIFPLLWSWNEDANFLLDATPAPFLHPRFVPVCYEDVYSSGIPI